MPRSRSRSAFLACALLLTRAGADTKLVDPAAPETLRSVEAKSATAALVTTAGGRALRVETTVDPKWAWPGVTLRPAAVAWNVADAAWLALEVRNVGSDPVWISWRLDDPQSDREGHKSLLERFAVAPGATELHQVRPRRRAAGAPVLFGMRGVPSWAQADGETAVALDWAHLTAFVIYVSHPTEAHAFELLGIRAGGRPAAPPAQPLPFIDTFGQYLHADWPGKVHSLDQLRGRRATEAQDLAQHPAPPDWDRWGGWQAGPQLAATGYFTTTQRDGRWWLVDPDGRLFFHHGMHGVRLGTETPITARDGWFADFPGVLPGLTEFNGRVQVGSSRSDIPRYRGQRIAVYNFLGANLKRKYGAGWRATIRDLTQQRLRSWGLNGIGGHSAPEFTREHRTPYCVSAYPTGARRLAAGNGYWGNFYDVFDPDFAARLRQAMAKEVGQSVGDPACLGYFSDNELAWGGELDLALATLECPAEQAAKQEFIKNLRARYATISALNTAWGTAHASWEALLAWRGEPDKVRARDDLVAFAAKTADRYFEQCAAAIRAAAPRQLYLGCRFAWTNDGAVRAAAKYCDVLSFNLYRPAVSDFQLPAGVDKPVIITEFHFGALDRGLFAPGLVVAGSQAERAAMYQAYLHSVLTHPQMVGCNWFMLYDQPTTGSPYGGGENYQIGFLDTADTPYPETVAAARAVGAGLYRVRASH